MGKERHELPSRGPRYFPQVFVPFLRPQVGGGEVKEEKEEGGKAEEEEEWRRRTTVSVNKCHQLNYFHLNRLHFLKRLVGGISNWHTL